MSSSIARYMCVYKQYKLQRFKHLENCMCIIWVFFCLACGFLKHINIKPRPLPPHPLTTLVSSKQVPCNCWHVEAPHAYFHMPATQKQCTAHTSTACCTSCSGNLMLDEELLYFT